MPRYVEFEGVPNTAAPVEGPLTVSNTAVTLLSLLAGGALHTNTRFVRVSCETDDVRLTIDGATPTATKGRKLLADSSRLLSRNEADLCKAIRITTDAALQIEQYIS